MLLVLGLAALLWGLGALLGAPRGLRWGMVGLVWAGVVALHLTLPAGHAMREATGQSAALWLMLGGFAVLVLTYGAGLRMLKRRALRTGPRTGATPARSRLFSEAELDRYARHIVLREIGGPGQKALKQARVMVIGAGGLGSPVLMYLAAGGVGTIGVIDDDVVENSNLQRQVIHRDADIGRPKVQSATDAMVAQNPAVRVHPIERRLTAEIAEALFADYDLVLDGTDNFEARYLANAAAHATGRPLISGAMAQWEGQLSVFDTARGTPCYRCIFPEPPAPGLAPSCSEAGVLGPLPGVLGAMMAAEAIKIVTGAGMPLRGEMLIFDALYGETRKIALARRPDCPVCGGVRDARPGAMKGDPT